MATYKPVRGVQPTINVKDFGALGDGTTNDRTAIQNAINSVSAGQQGTVYFPPGTYMIGSSFSFGTRKIQFVGAGIGRSIIKAASGFSSFAMIYDYTDGISDIEITGLTFDANSLDGKGVMEMGTCSNVYIHNNEFKNVASPTTSHWTVLIGEIVDADIAASASYNVVFTDNYVHDNGNGTNETILPINCRDSRFDNNYFKNNTNSAFTLNLFGYCNNSTANGNIFRNCREAIYILSSDTVEVCNNQVYSEAQNQALVTISNSYRVKIGGNLHRGYRSGGSAVSSVRISDRAGTFDGHAQQFTGSRFVDISDNNIHDVYTAIAIATGNGIFNAYEASDIDIRGNQLFACEWAPISIGQNLNTVNLQNIVIEGNYLGISNQFDAGSIRIVGDSTTPTITRVKNITIKNNKILPSARANAAGIELNACSDIIVTGNDLRGTGKGTLASNALYIVNGATTAEVFDNLGWTAALPSHITTAAGVDDINDLTDVSITTPADYDVMFYNSGSGQWENQPLDANLVPVTPVGNIAATDVQSAISEIDTELSSRVVRVIHGSTASTARPSGVTYVEWVGSVAPDNANTTNDTWIDTA